MASIQQRGDKWQVRIKHKILPRPLFATLDDEAQARAYAHHMESLLDRGIVPAELLEEKRGADPLLKTVIAAYRDKAPVAPSDGPMLDLLEREVGLLRLSAVTAAWSDRWVADLKVGGRLAPGTIRKRVGCLARVLDWHWRLSVPAGTLAPVNPLRLLPRGYSQYSEADAVKLAAEKKQARHDAERDRRLLPEEEARIRQALAGQPRKDRERALPVDNDFMLLFDLILLTGLRLSEAFRLRVDQLDFGRWVINVEGSKGARGKRKPRMVPMVKEIREPLQTWCAGRAGLVFSFWDGSPEDRPRATNRLSHRFGSLFGYAKVEDFTEHDLRHEATCRWFLMRDAAGRWLFSDLEICKIMGWTSTKMALRYLSLRGEDLSARLG